jgi:U11/U12 small nuclear ribonucleoprotein SNRNP48
LCFKAILRDVSVLNNALVWLESQVSILYGVNGKFFVLNFVKKCILVGASVLLLFPLGNEVGDSVDSKEEKNNTTDCIQERKILMPQVVVAVAALHERALLERKIKGFWFSHPSNNYQLYVFAVIFCIILPHEYLFGEFETCGYHEINMNYGDLIL